MNYLYFHFVIHLEVFSDFECLLIQMFYISIYLQAHWNIFFYENKYSRWYRNKFLYVYTFLSYKQQYVGKVNDLITIALIQEHTVHSTVQAVWL